MSKDLSPVDAQTRHAIEAAARFLSRRVDDDSVVSAWMEKGSTPAPFVTAGLNSRIVEDVWWLRACADALAVRRRFHDPGMNAPLGSPESARRQISEALFQIRCEALGRAAYPGMALNLDAALEAQSRARAWGQTCAPDPADLSLAVALRATESIAGAPLPAGARHLLGYWREALQAIDGALQLCAQHIQDQRAFTRGVMALLDVLELHDTREPPDSADSARSEEAPKTQNGLPERTGRQDVPSATAVSKLSADVRWLQGPNADVGGGDTETGGAAWGSATAHLRPRAEEAYRVFTRQFDETVAADTLCTSAERAELWLQLQTRAAEHGHTIRRLVGRLQRKLLASQYLAVERDQEEGLLDAARLARVITTPRRPLACKREVLTPHADTAVTLLIDNSASMRGRAISIAMATASVLGQVLEQCGVTFEILGYTTREWKGGASRGLWIDRGRPPSPGRLNDVRHIIYKEASARWRQTRMNLGVAFKPGLLKENIDGEAVVWAYARLLKRVESRRILMVICDGAPIDDSTLSNNDAEFLSAHLKSVTHRIACARKAELIGIGVRRDVSAFYPRSVRVPEVSVLGEVLIKELAGLLEQERRRREP